MSSLPSDIERYTQLLIDLREQVRESHETLRDLREERKQLLELRKTWLRNAEQELRDAFVTQFTEFSDTLPDMFKTIEARIYARFDTLMLIILGEDPESKQAGKRSVVDMITDFIAQQQLPIAVTVQPYLLISHETASADSVLKTLISVNALPLVYDSRVKLGRAVLVIPPESDGEQPQVLGFNVSTGAGAAEAIAKLEAHLTRTYAAPSAFQPKSRKD